MSSGIATPLARYSACRQVGDYLFLSGVIAVDPHAGKVMTQFSDLPPDIGPTIGQTGEMSVDVKQGPALVQSWYVLDRIRATVEQAGGQMSDVFKLVQYFTDLRDFPLYNQVRKQFFPGEPPVSTVVEVSGMLPTAEVIIEVEATAYLPSGS